MPQSRTSGNFSEHFKGAKSSISFFEHLTRHDERQIEPWHSECVHALASREVADVRLRLGSLHDDHPTLLHDGLAVESPYPRKRGEAIIHSWEGVSNSSSLNST